MFCKKIKSPLKNKNKIRKMSKSKNQRQPSSNREERQETYTASLHITSSKVKVKKRLSSAKKTKRYSNPNDKQNNSREKRRQQQRDEMIQMQMDEYGCGKGTAWETWRRPHSDYLTEKELEECGNNIFKILGHERRVQQTPVTLDETIVPNASASTSQRRPSTSKPNKSLKRNNTATSTKRVPKTSSSSVNPPVIDIDVDCESDVVLLD
ncbi:hypothetical protein WR25_23745 isoform C [Diploscapter pachys]|uniref:Uncharacterized protein n=3 Tax=Diploscapter pachys TaxID=2018661 RepID=A0A2A2JFQ6_9BILA|nr:hypothetical protein WR25_23745 isoform C [Diploscapter pachys]